MGADPNNPCTTSAGNAKRRYPTSLSAWFVADLIVRGLHKDFKKPVKLHKYHCPRCDGFHLTKCRLPKDFRNHDQGIEWLWSELRKITLFAEGKKTLD